MRALVTGATGFIGGHLVRALVARGNHVRALVRDPKKACLLPQSTEVRYGDLRDPASLKGIASGMDVVFHLGAAIQGSWDRHRLITVKGTRRVLEAASAAGVQRFVHVSSLAVYDKARIGPDDIITEQSPLLQNFDVAGPYARGKIESERLVQDLAGRANMEFVVARPGLVYGPGHVIFEHLGVRLGRGAFLALGGSSVRLPLVHIDSVVDALLRLAEAPPAAGHTFNIVDDEQASKAEYLRTLSQMNCRRYRCIGLPAMPLTIAVRTIERLRAGGRAVWLPKVSAEKIHARTTERRYDCSSLRTLAAWRPSHDLTEGLRAAFSSKSTHRPPMGIQRVGLIGAGRIAGLHVAALRQIPGIEIVGVLDIDKSAAQALAGRFGIPMAFSDVEEFYTRARPESVHILTPPRSHTPLALDAIRRGCHVLLEKPAVMTLEECGQLEEAAREAGVVVGVDHNLTTDPRIRRARTMIDRCTIGDLVHIDIFWAFDIRRFTHMLAGNSGKDTWATELPGGPLEDLAPHPLSLAFTLLNEDVQLTSARAYRSGRHEHAFDDELRLLLAGGRVTANVNLSLSAAPDDLTVTIYGSRSTLRLDLHNLLMIESRQGPGPKAIARGLRIVRGGAGTIMQTARNVVGLATKRVEPPASPASLIRDHYAALAAGEPLPVDLDQGRAVVEIVRAVWPSLTHSPPQDLTPMLFTRDSTLSLDLAEPGCSA